VEERFYAISADRKFKHPAVVAISDAARTGLFAGATAAQQNKQPTTNQINL
jgi:hypothetical protein